MAREKVTSSSEYAGWSFGRYRCHSEARDVNLNLSILGLAGALRERADRRNDPA
jgi:hypothetical protein